ncbi:unnamed protein product, partial [Rotaria sp. Silwood2]
ICDGFFYMQRIPSSCMETTLKLNTNGSSSNNCLTFDWSQISNLTTNYTTYINSDTNQTYYAQGGALTVLGNIDNYSLNYECPPIGYNGVGSGCQTQPNTELVVLHVNAIDHKLYAMDIILSGTPFPAPDNLKDNQPPFGKAHHQFTTGISVQSAGYFQICKSKNSDQCPNKNLDVHRLPHPIPSNYGYGIYAIQVLDFVTNATWIMDDSNKLHIAAIGTIHYYFNTTGSFIYDSTTKTCTWSKSCNYACEVYDYNSRFLDFGGEWIITKKWGIEDMQPQAVETWIGHTIGAAGVFPIIMYTDKKTGHFLGVDKLDAAPTLKTGATFFFTDHGNTTPRTSIEAYHPNVVEAGCVKTITEWMGVRNNTDIDVELL